MQIHDFNQLPVIGGKDVDFSFEYSGELIFVHLPEVRRMTKSTLQEIMLLIEEWGPFLRMAGYPAVFGLIPKENKRILKLADRLGFVIHGYKNDHIVIRLDLGEN